MLLFEFNNALLVGYELVNLTSYDLLTVSCFILHFKGLILRQPLDRLEVVVQLFSMLIELGQFSYGLLKVFVGDVLTARSRRSAQGERLHVSIHLSSVERLHVVYADRAVLLLLVQLLDHFIALLPTRLPELTDVPREGFSQHLRVQAWEFLKESPRRKQP